MCNANSTEIPEWINDYQPEEGLDDEEKKLDNKLYNLFKELYAQPDNITKQKRTINKIWTFLINNHLLIDLSHQKFNHLFRKDSLLEPNDIYSKAYEWISEASIIINSELLTVLNSYCNNNKNEATIKLSTHIFNLNTHKINSKEHKKEQNDIRSCIKELSNKEGNNDFIKESNIHFYKVPRIWLFRPESSRITHHLRSWINQFIKWRIKDLYRHTGKEIIESLDTPQFRDNKSGENRIDYTPDGSQMLAKCPTMQELTNGDLFNTISRNEEKEIRLKLRRYLEDDPYKLLASRYIKGYPECTYKILVDRRILKEPPDSRKDIADEFGIEYQNFASAELLRNFYPTIASIRIEIGYHSVALKQAIIDDTDGELRKCKKVVKRKVVYDAQLLAQKLLPAFQQPEIIFSKVVNYLNTQGHQLRTSKIFMSNENSSFEIFFEIAKELKEQGYDSTSYDVLECWKTVKIEEFSQELHKQKYKISPPAIRYFWENKCRKCLGKLLIDLNNNKKGK
jgi:hypothetical protein